MKKLLSLLLVLSMVLSMAPATFAAQVYEALVQETCTHQHVRQNSDPVATCATAGVVHKSCLDCGHEWSENIGLDPNNHERKQPDSQEEDRMPTCYEDGVSHYFCEACYTWWEEVVPKMNHTYEWGGSYLREEKTVAPTCAEAGYTVYRCSYINCGCPDEEDGRYREKRDLVSALTHKDTYDFSELPANSELVEVITALGCTVDGRYRYRCLDCQATYLVTQSAQGHQYVDGYCAVCGEVALLASGTCGENLTWALSEDGVLTISGTGAMYDYNKDSNVAPWFDKWNKITSVVIEDGVSWIGAYAFYGCWMESVTIANTVTKIHDGAFRGCTKLAEIVIPDGVTSIGERAFSGCSSLTNVTIPDGVTSIGESAFEYCSSLTNVTIPDSVTSIGESAFVYCSSLTSVTIPDGVASIGYGTFYGCSSLTSVTIPDSVTSIGELAFYQCSSLTSVTIPDSVTSIGDWAFEYCSSLASVTIPDSVTSIGDWAFEYCSSLWHVLYKGTEEQWNEISIGSNNSKLTAATRHYNCTGDEITETMGRDATCTEPGLTEGKKCSVCGKILVAQEEIPAKGHQYVDGCCAVCGEVALLASGTCGKNLTWTLSENGVLTISGTGAMYNYNEDSDLAPWFYKWPQITSVVIEDGVGRIGAYAFYGCWYMESVTIANTVTQIDDGAFWDCRILTSVTIPNGVTSIGDAAFFGCGRLTSVTIPDRVTSIGESAFYNCSSLASVTIPDSVTSIGESAFFGCSSLTSVYITDLEAWCQIQFGNSAANPLNNGAALYLNGELVTDLVIPDTIALIKDYAFYGCSSLTSVTIPDRVISIGDSAFFNCSSLTSVTIPDSVTSIGDYAFSDCSSLASVYITDLEAWCRIPFDSYAANPLTYGAALYLNGELVTDLVIPDTITSIGDHAFYGCSSLTSVTIPDSVTSIGGNAFFNCNSLASVTIPDGVTSIGTSAFYNCSSLASVYITDLEAWFQIQFGYSATNPLTYGAALYLNGELVTDLVIPDTIANIGDYAFLGCGSLTSIDIPESVTSIGKYAFSDCSSLTSVTIGDGATSIGAAAFCVCTGLTSVTIGDGASIGGSAFSGCTGLAIVTIGDDASIGGFAFSDCSSLTSVTIGDGVTSIINYAFSGCSSLTSVTIPDSVTSICPSVFYGCSSLISVTIPDSVTSIGSSAFTGCSSLWHVLYKGTEEQWNEISIGSYNSNLTAATRHYNCTGDEITETMGQDATCTEAGEATHTCSICNESKTVSRPARGHRWKAATCTEPKTCTVCGATEGEALGHTEEIIPSKAATCTETGLTEGKKCSVCGEITAKQEEIPALGHEFVEGECTRCGEEDPDYAVVSGLLGDLNGSGEVNSVDVNILFRYLCGDTTQTPFTETQLLLADVNQDGEINSTDVNILYRYVMRDATLTWIPEELKK